MGGSCSAMKTSQESKHDPARHANSFAQEPPIICPPMANWISATESVARGDAKDHSLQNELDEEEAAQLDVRLDTSTAHSVVSKDGGVQSPCHSHGLSQSSSTGHGGSNSSGHITETLPSRATLNILRPISSNHPRGSFHRDVDDDLPPHPSLVLFDYMSNVTPGLGHDSDGEQRDDEAHPGSPSSHHHPQFLFSPTNAQSAQHHEAPALVSICGNSPTTDVIHKQLQSEETNSHQSLTENIKHISFDTKPDAVVMLSRPSSPVRKLRPALHVEPASPDAHPQAFALPLPSHCSTKNAIHTIKGKMSSPQQPPNKESAGLSTLRSDEKKDIATQVERHHQDMEPVAQSVAQHSRFSRCYKDAQSRAAAGATKSALRTSTNNGDGSSGATTSVSTTTFSVKTPIDETQRCEFDQLDN